MTRRTYIELSCNYCGQGDYYHPGSLLQRAKANGWVLTRNGDFCDKECKKNFEKRVKKDEQTGHSPS